ncbi:GNAT family N-acetyltransferase [Cryobacterium sp. Hh38]|nr:GNAT family N-acetyltransferase [Cryobacterium sp. Hh38]
MGLASDPPDSPVIGLLAVAPGVQGRGLGGALLTGATAALAGHGHERSLLQVIADRWESHTRILCWDVRRRRMYWTSIFQVSGRGTTNGTDLGPNHPAAECAGAVSQGNVEWDSHTKRLVVPPAPASRIAMCHMRSLNATAQSTPYRGNLDIRFSLISSALAFLAQ